MSDQSSSEEEVPFAASTWEDHLQSALLNLFLLCNNGNLDGDPEEYFGYQVPPDGDLLKSPDLLPSDSPKVRVSVNILHSSITLNWKETDFCRPYFVFDSLAPCTIDVYANDCDSAIITTKREPKKSTLLMSKSFQSGFKQQFECTEDDPWFDIRNLTEGNILFVIVIRATPSIDLISSSYIHSHLSAPTHITSMHIIPSGIYSSHLDSYPGPNYDIHCQISCCSLLGERSEGVTTIQKVPHGDVTYVTKDIFGLEKESLEEECAICLCEKKDTVILPCHHLCVCRECARILQSSPTPKCPICRGKMRGAISGDSELFPQAEIHSDLIVEKLDSEIINKEEGKTSFFPFSLPSLLNTQTQNDQQNKSLLQLIDQIESGDETQWQEEDHSI